jgi:tellurite resistance protein TerC
MISIYLFIIAFVAKLVYDIKNPHVNSPVKKCLFLVGACVLFAFVYGLETKSLDNALTWLTAFSLELVLSFDNLAVIMMIMIGAKLNEDHSKLVLNYGIMGAIFMRILLLTVGVGFATKFSFILFPIFGLYLGKVGYDMLTGHDSEKDTGWVATASDKLSNWLQKIPLVAKLIVPVSLVPIILQVEATDLLFAVDSIPAVLAISSSLPIVITSNLAAVSFLRELYLVFAELQKRMKYLTTGVSYAIIVVAMKLVAHPFLHAYHIEVPAIASFVLVLTPILISVAWSLLEKESTND